MHPGVLRELADITARPPLIVFDHHNWEKYPRGQCRVQLCLTDVGMCFTFAFSPLCLQQSQAIPLVSVASVTSGGGSGKAVKRQMSNVSEEDRGEKLEKAGEALEMGNVCVNV